MLTRNFCILFYSPEVVLIKSTHSFDKMDVVDEDEEEMKWKD